jgi:hypothetical protein
MGFSLVELACYAVGAVSIIAMAAMLVFALLCGD